MLPNLNADTRANSKTFGQIPCATEQWQQNIGTKLRDQLLLAVLTGTAVERFDERITRTSSQV
jgi:hypothetical protein